MIKHLKLWGVVALAGVLAACAQTQPRYGYSGSQPVYGSTQPVYSSNAPSYPAPVYDSSNGAYSSAGYNQTADGSTWGTVTRVDNLGTKKTPVSARSSEQAWARSRVTRSAVA